LCKKFLLPYLLHHLVIVEFGQVFLFFLDVNFSGGTMRNMKVLVVHWSIIARVKSPTESIEISFLIERETEPFVLSISR